MRNKKNSKERENRQKEIQDGMFSIQRRKFIENFLSLNALSVRFTRKRRIGWTKKKAGS